jgi:hypothetical protein
MAVVDHLVDVIRAMMEDDQLNPYRGLCSCAGTTPLSLTLSLSLFVAGSVTIEKIRNTLYLTHREELQRVVGRNRRKNGFVTWLQSWTAVFTVVLEPNGQHHMSLATIPAEEVARRDAARAHDYRIQEASLLVLVCDVLAEHMRGRATLDDLLVAIRPHCHRLKRGDLARFVRQHTETLRWTVGVQDRDSHCVSVSGARVHGGSPPQNQSALSTSSDRHWRRFSRLRCVRATPRDMANPLSIFGTGWCSYSLRKYLGCSRSRAFRT